MKPVLTAALLMLLAGCSGPLDTTYGATDPGRASVNGVVILRQTLTGAKEREPVRQGWMLSDRLQDKKLGCLVHIATSAEAISAEVQVWLLEWLKAEQGRQVVLVLRDGSVGGRLCRDWALQARNEALRLGPPQDQGLLDLADRLQMRALDEDHRDTEVRPGKDIMFKSLGFTVERQEPETLVRLQGMGLDKVPVSLALTSTITGAEVQSLVEARPRTGDRARVLVAGLNVEQSRLVVVASASALVDGALPDPASRQLLVALAGELTDFRVAHHGPPDTAVVGRLAVRRGDENDMDMLGLLFTQPPISYVAWHAMAVLLVFLAWRNRWLGRREAPRQEGRQRFLLHVQALARQLRQDGNAQAAAREIARWRGHEGTPPRDAAASAAWLDAKISTTKPKDPP